jgi:hypothetical protein
MKLLARLIISLSIIIVSILLVDLLMDIKSEYNLGILIMIVVSGSLSGVVTIWIEKINSSETKINS